MKIVRKILYWLIVIFGIYLIIELIRVIFGGSLGEGDMLSGVFFINANFTFYLAYKLSEHLGWHKGNEDF